MELHTRHRHSRECGNPVPSMPLWIPAFAGMTIKKGRFGPWDRLDPRLRGDDGKHSLFRSTIYGPGSGDGCGKMDGFMVVN